MYRAIKDSEFLCRLLPFSPRALAHENHQIYACISALLFTTSPTDHMYTIRGFTAFMDILPLYQYTAFTLQLNSTDTVQSQVAHILLHATKTGDTRGCFLIKLIKVK